MTEVVNDIPSRLEYLRKRIQPALEEPIRTHILVGVAAVGVGLGVGYLLGKRNKYEATIELDTTVDIHDDPNQMKIEFDSDDLAEALEVIQSQLKQGIVHIVEEERESVEDLVIDKDGPSVEDFVAERLKEAMTTGNGTVVVEEQEPVVESVFAADDDEWNQELEEMQRSKTEPYILHKDEFYADEMDYTQTTLTFYSGDSIMSDEEDTPIYNHEKITGPLRFGHGSGDPNVVYIRNDKLRAEYEILFDSGLFSVEVLGLDIPNNQRVRDRPRDKDIQHSQFRKFRDTE